MEMLVIFVLVLMLFGGKKMPDFARGLGKAMREFKRAAAGVEDEIRRAMDTESPPAGRPKPALPRPQPAAVSRPPVTPPPPVTGGPSDPEADEPAPAEPRPPTG